MLVILHFANKISPARKKQGYANGDAIFQSRTKPHRGFETGASLTITEWDSYESIKKFAGADFEKARYYPEDEKYLLKFEDNVAHYETFEY